MNFEQFMNLVPQSSWKSSFDGMFHLMYCEHHFQSQIKRNLTAPLLFLFKNITSHTDIELGNGEPTEKLFVGVEDTALECEQEAFCYKVKNTVIFTLNKGLW